MMAMFGVYENVATKDDIGNLGMQLRTEMGDLRTEMGEFRTEMGELRTEMAMMRQEMELKYATKDDLLELRRDFDSNLKSFIRTFVSVQAASMVGLTGIFYALVRLT